MDEYYNPETGVRGPTESNSTILLGCLIFFFILLLLAAMVVGLVFVL